MQHRMWVKEIYFAHFEEEKLNSDTTKKSDENVGKVVLGSDMDSKKACTCNATEGASALKKQKLAG